jgi:hypothetical protein
MWNTDDSHCQIKQEKGRKGESFFFELKYTRQPLSDQAGEGEKGRIHFFSFKKNKNFSLPPFLLLDLGGGCR